MELSRCNGNESGEDAQKPEVLRRESEACDVDHGKRRGRNVFDGLRRHLTSSSGAIRWDLKPLPESCRPVRNYRNIRGFPHHRFVANVLTQRRRGEEIMQANLILDKFYMK